MAKIVFVNEDDDLLGKVERAYAHRKGYQSKRIAHWRSPGTRYTLCGKFMLAGARNSIEKKRAAAMRLCPTCEYTRALYGLEPIS
jgi:hypothetical protein